jgi:heptosyltransferase-2
MADNVLVCGTNWMGDSVMSLPAVQALRRRQPGMRLTVCVKPGLVPLWEMHAAVDAVAVLEAGAAGVWRTARRLRRSGFERAYVFPNSFRSALLPTLARVPERVGLSGRQRAWMLTRVAAAPAGTDRRHQCWEYAAIVGMDAMDLEIDAPRLAVPEELARACASRFGLSRGGGWVGLIPGAARGPSKRWPAAHFAALGRLLRAEGRPVALFGAAGEAALCADIAERIGPEGVMNLAGKTGMREFAGTLGLCRVVVANDSGGMHLAAALGVRVVALFGMTDPAKTAPLGAGHRVLSVEGVRASRDIARDSREARACLERIAPERVFQAVRDAAGGP